jgi:hypothetical protein
LDEYEGVSKGYYARQTVRVKRSNGRCEEAQVYVLLQASAELRRAPFLEEYTLDFHRREYNPIRHIRVKQELYLAEHNRPFGTAKS